MYKAATLCVEMCVYPNASYQYGSERRWRIAGLGSNLAISREEFLKDVASPFPNNVFGCLPYFPLEIENVVVPYSYRFY